jgi:EAL domain-containing protein (putative c-di-GMP-specific phosphodiesterase class I)
VCSSDLVSASLGVTFYPQAEPIDADQLLRQADQAMYQAKQMGKNRYCMFDAERDRSVRGQHEELERIEQALAAQEFVLHYQPKVNMRTGEVMGAEALIRWQHPTRGLLPPAAFMPLVADHPLAIQVGEWVLHTAMAQIEAWKAVGVSLPVSVNIDAIQLEQADFVGRLRQQLAAHPTLAAGDLELEVLETSALDDVAKVGSVIAACSDMGVGFALDDFGTGYSSLTYLKRLPAGLLKIDQSFVRDMLEDPDDLSILEGVLGLSRAFQRQVIAEGVETLAHGDMLLRMGCEWGQGYAIARPMPAEAVPGWLSTWRPAPSWLYRAPSSREDLLILFAAVEHRAWIHKVVGFIQGELEAPPPLHPDHCRVGQWMKTETRSPHTERSLAVAALGPAHTAVHDLASELIGLKQAGQPEVALARLAELLHLRDLLLEQLARLLD